MPQSKKLKIQEEKFVKARALVTALKARHWEGLMRDQNVVGVAFGRREAHGEVTDDPAMIVYVMRKMPSSVIPMSRLLPRRLYIGGDYVQVDIVQSGPFYPLAFTAQERPATAGISIGNANEASAGTFGALVIDNTDGSQGILSNNHVMARQNAAALGETIVQPGVYDGGVSPADDIATLTRFVMINATGNTVDCALAGITGKVVDQVHNNLIPTASKDHPAIGLLFAGSCNRTIMNPIADVLTQLNVSFPAGASAITTADIGMNAEKVGRTTEYTTSTVKEIDASVTIQYDFGPATLDHQITTAWMSDAGDSGSVVYSGGAGGDEDHCGCGSTQAAESLLGTSLKEESCMAEAVRDRFLRHTLIGNWLIKTFFLNEDRFLARFRNTAIENEDRQQAQRLFKKHSQEIREAFLQGEEAPQRLTDAHLRDAQTALRRAQKYMERDEVAASDKVFALVKEHATGKNARELLALLNNEKLFEEVKQIAAKVKFLRTHTD
jgi:hypothetical protein